MPIFLPESGKQVSFNNIFLDFTDANIHIPSGETFSDIDSRTLNGSSVDLSSEIQLSPSSGTLNISTPSSGWLPFTFVGP